jgi:hypothetical protein
MPETSTTAEKQDFAALRTVTAAPFGASASSSAKHCEDAAQIDATTIRVATRLVRRRSDRENFCQQSPVAKWLIGIAIPLSKPSRPFCRDARQP